MPTLPSYLLRPRHVGTRDASSRALRITTHGRDISSPPGVPVERTGTGSRSENGLPVVQAPNEVWQQSSAGTPPMLYLRVPDRKNE